MNHLIWGIFNGGEVKLLGAQIWEDKNFRPLKVKISRNCHKLNISKWGYKFSTSS